MEILIILLIAVVIVSLFLRWIIIAIATLIAMITGGFFAGLGVGLFTYFLLKLAKWFSLAYLTAKAVALTSEQPEPKETTCPPDRKKL